MAEKYPNFTKSSLRYSKYWRHKIMKAFLFLIMILILYTKFTCALTWSPSVSTLNAITSEQWSFVSYSATETYGVKYGLVSSSMYYMYKLSPSNYVAVRRVSLDNSQVWMTAVSYNPKKGFAVDDLEVNLYFAINSILLMYVQTISFKLCCSSESKWD